MFKFIIIVTFAASSVNAGDPVQFTKTQYATRTFSQVVSDTQGRTVYFDSNDQCMDVAKQIIDKMLKDTAVIPIGAKCVQTEILPLENPK